MMIVKVDADGREFMINTDHVSCIVPQVGHSKDDDKTHLIEFNRSGGHFLITYKEFYQIAEKIEWEQKTGSRQDV
ncbi:MAG: hypothetical protein VKK42_19615 [Lyngbya sp.]|nr:hypothetical protein [Lyngbya sp.]